MKAISLWAQKGGVGKSMLAVQLAGFYAEQGKKVMVVDLDPQLSATDILNDGNNKNIVVQWEYPLPDRKGCSVFIFDFPSGAELSPPTKTVIVPLQPYAPDFRATQKAIEYLEGVGKKVVLVLNRFQIVKSEHRLIKKNMEQNFPGFICIKDRSIYGRCLSRGTSVFDIKLQNFYGIRPAQEEIKKLIQIWD